jgi:hypothetical protein
MLVPVSPLEDGRVNALPMLAAGRDGSAVLRGPVCIESPLTGRERPSEAADDRSAAGSPSRSESSGAKLSSLIVVVAGDLHVLQHGNRVVSKNGDREVQTQEVVCDATLVHPLVADGKARYI